MADRTLVLHGTVIDPKKATSDEAREWMNRCVGRVEEVADELAEGYSCLGCYACIDMSATSYASYRCLVSRLKLSSRVYRPAPGLAVYVPIQTCALGRIESPEDLRSALEGGEW